MMSDSSMVEPSMKSKICIELFTKILVTIEKDKEPMFDPEERILAKQLNKLNSTQFFWALMLKWCGLLITWVIIWIVACCLGFVPEITAICCGIAFGIACLCSTVKYNALRSIGSD